MSKRVCDVVLATVGLLLAWPVFLVVALLIKLDSRGPVFFRQERIGRDGRPFRILKFRTMVDNAYSLGPRLTQKRDPRITRIGQVLRWFKLDELPQLLNVLRGEMGVVGPRPEDPHFVALYRPEQRAVLLVRPGIVGPSQILGRDELELYPEGADTEQYYVQHILPKKLETDLEYVRHASLGYDLRLLIRGVAVTVLGSFKPKYFRLNREKIGFALLDTVLSLGIYLFAFGLKFDWNLSPNALPYLAAACASILVIRPPCFIYFGLYQNILKYLGTTEFVAVLRAVTLGTLLITASLFVLGFGTHSRAVLAIDWMLLVVVLFGYRLFLQATAERQRAKAERQSRPRIPALIVGATDMGEDLARELLRNPTLPYVPVAFVDDDPLKSGALIHRVPVMGSVRDLVHVARIKGARMVFIPFPPVPTNGSPPLPADGDARDVIEQCRQHRLEYRVLPSLDQLVTGEVGLAGLPGVSGDGAGSEKADGDGRDGDGRSGAGPGKPVAVRRRRAVVLVTGGAGYVGSHLTRKLLERDYRVRVLDNFLYGDHGLRDIAHDPRLEIVRGDVRHLGTVARAAKGATGVIALAALVGDAACELDPDETVATNYESVRVLADACDRQGVQRLVFASSCSVYGANSDLVLNEGSWLNPVSLYARTRIQAEEVLLRRTEGFEVVILRLATVFGLSPRMRFDLLVNTLTLHAVHDRRMTVLGGGQWRPNLHVQDAAEAFALGLEAPREKVEHGIFNVGSNESNHTILQVAELVKTHVPEATLEVRPDAADQRNYRVSFDKIRSVLGFQPRFSVEDGIQEIARALRDGAVPDPTADIYHNYRFLARPAPARPAEPVHRVPAGAIGG